MFHNIPDAFFTKIVSEYAFGAGQLIFTKEDFNSSLFNYSVYVQNNN